MGVRSDLLHRKSSYVQVTELKLKVDNVERERDFYFDKLRDIEILCQMPLLQNIPVSYSCLYFKYKLYFHDVYWGNR